MNVQTIPQKGSIDNIRLHGVNEIERAEEWLSERIMRGKSEAFAEVITMTPAIAAVVLSRNEANRPISRLNLDRIMNDIENGRWEFNGESVVLSEDGFLNDGQHRCLAVRETGRSIRTAVTFGAKRESRFTVDTGNARTVGNFVGMQGHADGNAVATVAQYVWLYRERNSLRFSSDTRNGPSQKLRRPTKSEVLQVANSFPDIHSNLSITKASAPAGRAVSAFCRWAIARKGGDAACAVFFDQLSTGAGLRNDSPILYVRERLLGPVKGAHPHERAQLIIKAWNMYRRGETIRTIERSDGVLRSGSFKVSSIVFPPIEA